MEKNILITDHSHNRIYQTYSELKKKLPPSFFRMKVFSTPKYNIKRKPLLKKIENDKNSKIQKMEKPLSINQFINGNKNIYILSNKTINLKNQRNLQKINNYEHKYNEMMKQTLLTEKDKNINGNDYNNSNTQVENINYDDLENLPVFKEFDVQPYCFHSSSINDFHMKNNIYLPKIIDRMKYSIPRNERDKNGFHIEGIGIFSNSRAKNDDIRQNTDNKVNDDIQRVSPEKKE
jgi:hypothetical protein